MSHKPTVDGFVETIRSWQYDRVRDLAGYLPARVQLFCRPVGVEGRTFAETNLLRSGSLPAPEFMTVERIFAVGVQPGKIPEELSKYWLEVILGSKVYARLPLPVIWSHLAQPLDAILRNISEVEPGAPSPDAHFPTTFLIERELFFQASLNGPGIDEAGRPIDFYIILDGILTRPVH